MNLLNRLEAARGGIAPAPIRPADEMTPLPAEPTAPAPASRPATAVPPSTNTGVPVLESGGRDPMVKELRRLVSRFAATPLMRPGKYRAKHRADS